MEKILNKDMAEFYGLTQTTLSNYKHNKHGRKEVYQALKFYFAHITKEKNARQNAKISE